MSEQIVTTQRTSKRWKALKLLSYVLVGGGVLGIAMAESLFAWKLLLGFGGVAGILLLLFASFMAWWHHD